MLDAGAEEVNDLGDSFEVISEATDLVAVRTALQAAGIDYESADIAFLPTMEVPLDEEHARRVFRLIDALEDSDDVQDVYANYSVSDEIMEKLGSDLLSPPGERCAMNGLEYMQRLQKKISERRACADSGRAGRSVALLWQRI